MASTRANNSLLLARRFGHAAQGVRAARRAEQRFPTRRPPRRESIADALDRADERDLVHEGVRHLRRCLPLLTAEEQILDLARLRFVAVTREEIVVEVLPASAHAADVERVVLLHHVAARLDVV